MSANMLQLQVAGRDSVVKAAGSSWAGLYRIGAVSALALVACTFIQAAVFILWPPPSFLPSTSAVADWFALLQRNWLVGLLNLDLVMLFDYVASLLLFLALCVALRGANRSLVTVAGALTVAGVVSYFAANPAFAMLSLAGQHAAATGATERTATVAAGQAVMANFAGSGFNTSYVLIAIAGLVLTAAMLGSNTFGRRTAHVGMVFYAMNLVPATAGTLGFVLSMASLVPMIAWLVLVARRLLQLAGQEGR
ncbi:MAG: hypothetical protein ACM30E_09210 [Nitrososphaerales archaeon]